MKGIRSNPNLAVAVGTLSERPGRNTFVAALFLFVVFAAACVKTAECDATVPCESGDVCYDYVCRRTCDADEECGTGSLCSPCQQDDAEGTIDHCFEATLFACTTEVLE